MFARTLMRLYVAAAAAISLAGLVYVFVEPPESMKVSRYGVPYFTPPVAHPITGAPVRLEELVRHYRGER